MVLTGGGGRTGSETCNSATVCNMDWPGIEPGPSRRKLKLPQLSVNIQSVPRSKHSPSQL